jgi:hypothetical protein
MTLDPGRVQAVFLAALEQESLAARIAVLDSECAADVELRHRVEALLIAHERPNQLLDRPLIASDDEGAAFRVALADKTDENKPLPGDPEQMP